MLMRCSSRAGAAFLGLVVAALSSLQPVAGQSKKRLVPFPEWASSFEEDAEVLLELVEIKVAGKRVTLGQPFDADENWLKDTTLRVRNISRKPIVAFGVGGGLLEGVGEELPHRASYRYGVAWNWGEGFDPEKEKPAGAVLKPGETVELGYSNVSVLTRKSLAKEGEGAFCKLQFMAPAVQFADGTDVPTPLMKFRRDGKP
jgi:hypothetical protein